MKFCHKNNLKKQHFSESIIVQYLCQWGVKLGLEWIFVNKNLTNIRLVKKYLPMIQVYLNHYLSIENTSYEKTDTPFGFALFFTDDHLHCFPWAVISVLFL
jgi:hypothetical protein